MAGPEDGSVSWGVTQVQIIRMLTAAAVALSSLAHGRSDTSAQGRPTLPTRTDAALLSHCLAVLCPVLARAVHRRSCDV